MPKFDFKIPSIVDTRAFAKVAADAAKLSSFSLPESTVNNLTGLSGIAAQQSKLLDSLKPSSPCSIFRVGGRSSLT